MFQLFRINPGLLIWVILFGGTALVCLLVGGMMGRAGASLRPIYWFGGFMLMVGLPQFAFHLYSAVEAVRREAPRREALQALASDPSSDAARQAVKQLFGPDADPALTIDATPLFADALAQAELGRFTSLPGGETVLLARFKGYSDAQRAWVRYLRDSGLNQLGGRGDSAVGYAVTRPGGDRAYVVHLDNLMGVWTAPSDSAIRARMAAGGFTPHRKAPLAMGTDSDRNSAPAQAGGSPTATAPAPAPASPGPFTWTIGAIGLALYLLLVVAYFFKGASWAGSASPRPGTPHRSVEELTARLSALNDTDSPIRIERGPRENEWFATWRYADARWVDLARARGLRSSFRVRMVLDPESSVVRATDYAARSEWSVGRGGADLEWKAMLGIVFFQTERHQTFGLQLDAQGRFTPNLSYQYQFNLKELKGPLTAATTEAGWTWRPVVWEGPSWLRWLTE